MTQSILDFLVENPLDGIYSTIYPSKRFADAGAAFKVTAMTNDQYNAYQKAAFALRDGKNMRFDQDKFNEQLVLNHVVEPNLKDAEAMARIGCTTPKQFLNKTLLPGEINRLAEEIASLSGFGSMDTLVEEAKN